MALVCDCQGRVFNGARNCAGQATPGPTCIPSSRLQASFTFTSQRSRLCHASPVLATMIRRQANTSQLRANRERVSHTSPLSRTRKALLAWKASRQGDPRRLSSPHPGCFQKTGGAAIPAEEETSWKSAPSSLSWDCTNVWSLRIVSLARSDDSESTMYILQTCIRASKHAAGGSCSRLFQHARRS